MKDDDVMILLFVWCVGGRRGQNILLDGWV